MSWDGMLAYEAARAKLDAELRALAAKDRGRMRWHRSVDEAQALFRLAGSPTPIDGDARP